MNKNQLLELVAYAEKPISSHQLQILSNKNYSKKD